MCFARRCAASSRSRARARVPAAKRKPPAKARFTAADRAMVLVESLQGFGDGEITDTGDEISFRRVGRAGRRACASSSAANTASKKSAICTACASTRPRRALREFLADALAHNLRCVRIIHGKGKNSGPRGPVIKTAVNMILRKTGAGAGVHVGAARRWRHRRDQRVVAYQA